jgi:hypothetical protein
MPKMDRFKLDILAAIFLRGFSAILLFVFYQQISKKLGVSLAEFKSIVDLPGHWYKEYPNDEKWLGYVYDTYRKILKKDKLGSF